MIQLTSIQYLLRKKVAVVRRKTQAQRRWTRLKQISHQSGEANDEEGSKSSKISKIKFSDIEGLDDGKKIGSLKMQEYTDDDTFWLDRLARSIFPIAFTIFC